MVDDRPVLRFADIIVSFGECRDYLLRPCACPFAHSHIVTMQGKLRLSIRSSISIFLSFQDLINTIHPTMMTPNTKVSIPTEVRLLANGSFWVSYSPVIYRQTRLGR